MKPAVLSGIRPTGRMHLGNYFGALKNWVGLQEKYTCYFFVADYHALTTGYERPKELAPNVEEMIIDMLAAGLDPNRSTLFVQSMVPTHAEAHLLFSMFTPNAWLERTPSYKEMIETMTDRDLRMYGFLGYPLLQCVDILLYHPKYVPVGVDQVAHIEFTRETIRRFNHLYGTELPQPEPLLTPSSKVPGTDGRKMSKSYGNTLELFMPKDEARKKIMSIKTDSTPVAEPKNPETCSVYALLSLFCDEAEMREWDKRYRQGGLGYGDAKKALAEKYEEKIGPMRARREELAKDRAGVWKVMREGSERAREVSMKHLKQIREAMGLTYGGWI